MNRIFFYGVAFWLGLACFFGGTPEAQAQVGLTLEVNFKNFLQNEPVWVRLTIHNYSGHPLPFTDSGPFKTKFAFEVENSQTHLLAPLGEVQLPVSGFVLAPNKAESLIIPLSAYYDLRRLGSYQVRAVVDHPSLNSKYQSNFSSFTVSRGVKVFAASAGVTNTTNRELTKIASRDVNILSMFDGQDKAYYLNIEDEKQIYAQIRVGYEIDPSRVPSCVLDAANNIHILMYISPKLLVYFMFDIDGTRLKREVMAHDNQGMPPVLQVSVDGDVRCFGGRLAKKNEYVEEPNNRFRAAKKTYE